MQAVGPLAPMAPRRARRRRPGRGLVLKTVDLNPCCFYSLWPAVCLRHWGDQVAGGALHTIPAARHRHEQQLDALGGSLPSGRASGSHPAQSKLRVSPADHRALHMRRDQAVLPTAPPGTCCWCAAAAARGHPPTLLPPPLARCQPATAVHPLLVLLTAPHVSLSERDVHSIMSCQATRGPRSSCAALWPLQVEAFLFGSVPLRAVLPDGDIDISVFATSPAPGAPPTQAAAGDGGSGGGSSSGGGGGPAPPPPGELRDSWASRLLRALEREAARPDAPFRIRNVQVIQAEVRWQCCFRCWLLLGRRCCTGDSDLQGLRVGCFCRQQSMPSHRPTNNWLSG